MWGLLGPDKLHGLTLYDIAAAAAAAARQRQDKTVQFGSVRCALRDGKAP